ncbi:unknown [Fusobacterium sp. CAG:439]|nr:unknown [Fusobacterium sp. CAG:439]HIT93312.1 hypothetical protein [Candidatus Stercorousia faecigallinarum]
MKKKILLITALLLFLSSSMPVQAEENQSEQLPAEKIKPVVLPPKWTDFCELGYENAVYKNSHDIFNIFSFVKSERVKKNYWAERRVSFESYLDSCNKLDDDAKSACYAELRNIENQKNDLYRIKRKQLLYENNIELNRR